MTPEQVDLVTATSSRLVLRPAAARFYARLFAAEPDLRQLFPGDLAAQEAKVAAGLALVVATLRDHPALRARCRRSGGLHRAYGAEPRHYAAVGTALLGALRDELGAAWDAELEQAWTAAYTLVAELMMSGAQGPEVDGR